MSGPAASQRPEASQGPAASQGSSAEPVPRLWPANFTADGGGSPRAAGPFRSVGFTISTTGYAIGRRFRELLAPLGLEPRDFALLQTVARTEGVSQHAIGERMNVAPSRMVAFVDSLEERGFLERRQNPDDRRARALFLTRRGRRVLERAISVAAEYEQGLTNELSSEQREQLLDLLASVGAQVGIPPDVHAGMGHSAMADE